MNIENKTVTDPELQDIIKAANEIFYRQTNQSLSDLQVKILESCYLNLNEEYQKIAENAKFSLPHTKNEGAKLWKVLGSFLKEKVTKKNFINCLKKYIENQAKSTQKITEVIKNFRDYIYISEEKINIIFPQISQNLKQSIANELNINLEDIKINPQSRQKLLENQINRLSIVEKYIEKYQKIGTIDNPETWVFGTEKVVIANFTENDQLVFFIGTTENSKFLLGGSIAHLLSEKNRDDINIGWSFLPRLLYGLEQYLSWCGNPELSNDSEFLEEMRQISIEKNSASGYWDALVEQAHRFTYGSEMKIQFLAKTLKVQNKSDDFSLVLATPLYVANIL